MWLVFGGLLLKLSLIDIKKRILPNWLLLLAAFNRALWILLCKEPVVFTLKRMLPGLAASLALLFFVLFYEYFRGQKAMGRGDIKLMFVMALYLDGARLLLALLIGCLLGIFAAFLAGRKGSDTIPFGPFLAAGCLFAAAFGEPFAAWYMGTP